MRTVRIFFLHFEGILDQRTRSLVWFLIPLIDQLLFIVFWKGALIGKSEIATGWSLSSISSYYFLLIIAAALLMCHIEEDVSEEDIKQGNLVKYLTRPFSYYWLKFFEEIPYRLLQGSYGIILYVLLIIFFGNFVVNAKDPFAFLPAIIIAIFALFISFTYKMMLGLSALWVTDVGGLFQLDEMIMLIFAGFILPLELLPKTLFNIANILPYSYMIYYPVLAFEGKLEYVQMLQVIGIQAMWLFVLVLLYKYVLSVGIKRFSGVGN